MATLHAMNYILLQISWRVCQGRDGRLLFHYTRFTLCLTAPPYNHPNAAAGKQSRVLFALSLMTRNIVIFSVSTLPCTLEMLHFSCKFNFFFLWGCTRHFLQLSQKITIYRRDVVSNVCESIEMQNIYLKNLPAIEM